MVINLRGTSGSGKTTVVRGIMAKGDVIPLGGTAKKPEAYAIQLLGRERPVYAIGSYENTCGGCDAVSPGTQDEICRRIRHYAALGDVLVEGLLMSHLFSRYAMLDRELHAKGIQYIWAFLDTPLDVCLQRVEARREERRLAKTVVPEFKPLNPKNTTDRWHAMSRVHAKCLGAREKDWKDVKGYRPAPLDARWMEHQHAVDEVYGWLCP